MENNTSKKLLIVDSDLDSKDDMLSTLQKYYEVVVIDNATDAMEYSESFIPDIILVDLDMPQIDGFQFLNMLDEHPTLCDIPVISMTDNKGQKYSDRAYQEGAIGIIYKPFNIANLVRDIKGVLKHTSSEIVSSNKRITYLIEFSENSKIQRLKELIKNQDYENEPLIVLSWNRGEDLLNDFDEVQEKIENEQLIYLEMKPSLISKFPYLQDTTPIILDIKSFLKENSRKYHLVMDEPGFLLNIHQEEKSISQTYNIAQLLHSDFNKITYVNTRPQSTEAVKFVSRVGNILTGVRN